MSGVVYAVFGYVWMRGSQEPELGMRIDYRTVQMMLFLAGPSASRGRSVTWRMRPTWSVC